MHAEDRASEQLGVGELVAELLGFAFLGLFFGLVVFLAAFLVGQLLLEALDLLDLVERGDDLLAAFAFGGCFVLFAFAAGFFDGSGVGAVGFVVVHDVFPGSLLVEADEVVEDEALDSLGVVEDFEGVESPVLVVHLGDVSGLLFRGLVELVHEDFEFLLEALSVADEGVLAEVCEGLFGLVVFDQGRRVFLAGGHVFLFLFFVVFLDLLVPAFGSEVFGPAEVVEVLVVDDAGTHLLFFDHRVRDVGELDEQLLGFVVEFADHVEDFVEVLHFDDVERDLEVFDFGEQVVRAGERKDGFAGFLDGGGVEVERLEDPLPAADEVSEEAEVLGLGGSDVSDEAVDVLFDLLLALLALQLGCLGLVGLGLDLLLGLDDFFVVALFLHGSLVALVVLVALEQLFGAA